MILLILLITVISVIVVNSDNKSLSVSEYDINANVESSFRIVHLSDLHETEFGVDNEDLIMRVKELAPDVICITGDFLNGDSDNLSIMETVCRKLVSVAPVYFVPGNHEVTRLRKGTFKLRDILEPLGVHLLFNEMTEIEINGTKVDIAGYVYKEADDSKNNYLQQLYNADGYRIMLTHEPLKAKKDVDMMKMDLCLLGHAHGGQVRIPFIGGLYSSDQGLFPKYTSGCRFIGLTNVIISRGLGGSTNFPRILNEPEICVININAVK